MKSIEELAKKAKELKEKGLSDKEISTEMHLSLNTILWLLSGEYKGKEAPRDVKIGWRSIGVYSSRIYYLSEIMADIINEELYSRGIEPDTILGITINGIPIATFISDILGKEISIFRPSPHKGEGSFSSNYAKVTGKKVVIVDDVVSTGETVSKAIEAVKSEGGEPVLIVVIVNKTEKDEILGVPIRGLIRARMIG